MVTGLFERFHKLFARGFYKHGTWCAQHQFLVILFSAILVLGLAGPAYLTYYRDSPPSRVQSQGQYAMFWESAGTRSPIPNELFVEQFGDQPWLRIEQVVFTSINGAYSNTGVLDKEMMLYIHTVQQMLLVTSVNFEDHNYTLQDICFKSSDTTDCLITTPMLFWSNDPDILNSDDSIYNTISAKSFAKQLPHLSSVFGNLQVDRETRTVRSADSLILSFFLMERNGSIEERRRISTIWSEIWRIVEEQISHALSLHQYSATAHNLPSSYAEGTIPYKTLYLTHRPPATFLANFPAELLLLTLAYIIVFLYVSLSLGRVQLVKSKFGLGLTAVCEVCGSLIGSLGVCSLFGVRLTLVPWEIFPFMIILVGVENMFIITNAVVGTDLELRVPERLARGLEKVGVSITCTLLAELGILIIGTAISIPAVREFCLFGSVAIIIDWILQMTFFITVLSIDIRRLELSDLQDRRVRRHLSTSSDGEYVDELDGKLEGDKVGLDALLIPKDGGKGTDWIGFLERNVRSHRIFSSIMMLIVVLALAYVYRSNSDSFASTAASNNSSLVSAQTFFPTFSVSSSKESFFFTKRKIIPFWDSSIAIAADDFWNAINPEKKNLYVVIGRPIHVSVQRGDDQTVDNQRGDDTGEYRGQIIELLMNLWKFLVTIEMPIVVLIILLLGSFFLVYQTTPKKAVNLQQSPSFMRSHTASDNHLMSQQENETSSSPTIKQKSKLSVTRISPSKNVEQVTLPETQSVRHYHRGSLIDTTHVQIVTLRGRHFNDLQSLDINQDGIAVTCGQDGRVVLWDAVRGIWKARLDKLISGLCGCGCGGSCLGGMLNTDIFGETTLANPNALGISDSRKSSSLLEHSSQFSTQRGPARVVKIDPNGSWVAAGFDDGCIRVWSCATGELVRELESSKVWNGRKEEEVAYFRLRKRGPVESERITNMISPSLETFNGVTSGDRVTQLAFIDSIVPFPTSNSFANISSPLSTSYNTEASSCSNFKKASSQTYLISAHRSGFIREWDLNTGDCINSIKTEHRGGISFLRVSDGIGTNRRLGRTWVFTIGRTGLVECWERRIIMPGTEVSVGISDSKPVYVWRLVYKINGHDGSPITSIGVEPPVGGIGIVVTGSQDGAIKVWDFESGENICVVSCGLRLISRKRAAAASTGDNNYHVPLHERDQDEGRCCTSTFREFGHFSSSVLQLAVARYCEVDTGPSLCRGCETCFGTGFIVAAACADEIVRVYRLETNKRSKEFHRCKLCGTDYHHQHYRHHKSNTTSDLLPSTSFPIKSTNNTFTRPISSSSAGICKTPHSTMIEKAPDLLDIEQLAGDTKSELDVRFLGKISQPGGRGVVFCTGYVLSGMRRKSELVSKMKNKSRWEIWMAELKAFEPNFDAKNEDDMEIPLHKADLDQKIDEPHSQNPSDTSSSPSPISSPSLFGWLLSSKVPEPAKLTRQRSHRRSTSRQNITDGFYNDSDVTTYDDTDRLLPFTSIRHLMTAGADAKGVFCDFGNFAKVVWIGSVNSTSELHLMPAKKVLRRTNTVVAQVKTEKECACGNDESSCGKGDIFTCRSGIGENATNGSIRKRLEAKK